MHKLKLLLPAACMLVLTAFTTGENAADLIITQKKKLIRIDNAQTTIELSRSSFTLLFKQKEYKGDRNEIYSTQIAFTLDKNDLAKIREGASTSTIDFFSPGTGFATSGHYRSTFINSGETVGHHYFIYEKGGEQRANLVKEQDGMLQLKHEVKEFIKDSKTIKIKKVNFPELYMIVLSDGNLNQVIDKGEYRLVTIKFK